MAIKPPPLSEAVAQLAERMTRFPVAMAHIVPDSVLYGYAIDVLEQARAVEILAESSKPRASFANARAALEAAGDLMYLVRSEDEYDMGGGLARCHELLEHDDLKDRLSRANIAEGDHSPAWVHAAEIVAQDATTWDTIEEGKGDILRNALRELQGRRRGHWSGLSRRKIVESVAGVVGASPGWAAMLDAAYGLASTHAHPRPRSGGRTLTHEGDTFIHGPRPEDGDVPSQLASLACIYATDALNRRMGFFRSDSGPAEDSLGP